MKRHEQRIYRLALGFLSNHHDAEDILQEVCLKAFTHLGTFRGESPFGGWLARIATNECLMKIRRGKGIQQLSLDDGVEADDGDVLPREIEDWRDTPDKAYEKSEMQAIVADCMAKLDPGSRLIFLLRDVEEFTIEETVQATGLSVAAVKTRLFRARLKMREHMNVYFRKDEKSCAVNN